MGNRFSFGYQILHSFSLKLFPQSMGSELIIVVMYHSYFKKDTCRHYCDVFYTVSARTEDSRPSTSILYSA
jgi:hypothetical protein